MLEPSSKYIKIYAGLWSYDIMQNDEDKEGQKELKSRVEVAGRKAYGVHENKLLINSKLHLLQKCFI